MKDTSSTQTTIAISKIAVGISACLLGHEVRFDGGHKRNSYIQQTLGEYFDFVTFCPEVDIGLGIPRPALRLVADTGDIRCVGIKDPTQDVTEALIKSADAQSAIQADLCGYILKKDSPSCGMERVKTYTNSMPSRNGSGIFAQRLMQNFPDLPVEEEGRLGDPVLRENFIQRVFIYARWKQLMDNGLSASALLQFHARHKLIIMSHNQTAVKQLGGLLADLGARDLESSAALYIENLMVCLKTTATRGNHTNVLQHIQGYLKRDLDADDKAELNETIEQYRLGIVPLIVPITLLRHHFRKSPSAYIDESFYMTPHPAELSLLNSV